METVREYTLGIGAAAMICAITLAFAGTGKLQPLLKLICGLILTFTVVKPVLAFSSGDLSLLLGDCQETGEQAAREGRALAEDALREGIRERTEAYILEKAGQLDLAVRPEVELSAGTPPVPRKVTLRGTASPYERRRLSWILMEELKLQKENIRWVPDR